MHGVVYINTYTYAGWATAQKIFILIQCDVIEIFSILKRKMENQINTYKFLMTLFYLTTLKTLINQQTINTSKYAKREFNMWVVGIEGSEFIVQTYLVHNNLCTWYMYVHIEYSILLTLNIPHMKSFRSRCAFVMYICKSIILRTAY